VAASHRSGELFLGCASTDAANLPSSKLPDELTGFGGLIGAPNGSNTTLAAMVVCRSGPLDAGERAASPIKEFGAPVTGVIGAMPYMGASRYANYLTDDEHSDGGAAAYGPSYRRLRQLKAKCDPENFFHINPTL
jgi:berberine-like enzyme